MCIFGKRRGNKGFPCIVSCVFQPVSNQQGQMLNSPSSLRNWSLNNKTPFSLLRYPLNLELQHIHEPLSPEVCQQTVPNKKDPKITKMSPCLIQTSPELCRHISTSSKAGLSLTWEPSSTFASFHTQRMTSVSESFSFPFHNCYWLDKTFYFPSAWLLSSTIKARAAFYKSK